MTYVSQDKVCINILYWSLLLLLTPDFNTLAKVETVCYNVILSYQDADNLFPNDPKIAAKGFVNVVA